METALPSQSYNAHDMLGAVKRALGLYADKEAWQKVVVHAMECVSAGKSQHENILPCIEGY